jgi:predicted enzyme related to lactoylglutathione lyase
MRGMADDVSRVRQVRLSGVPHTHLAFLRFRIPCRDPESVATFWSVILGNEPDDVLGEGAWFIGANVGNSGASFEFYPAPEKVTDLSRLALDILTEDLSKTTELAIERGGTVEHEQQNAAGRVVWRRVIDPEGNWAGLAEVDDIDEWWGRDVEGKPWPPAGAARHLYPRQGEPGSASPQWLPITYRNFYDIPRAVLVEHEGEAYFLACSFDEEADEYPLDFTVYRLPEEVAEAARQPTSTWVDLGEAGTLLGRVPVKLVRFDESRRRFLHSEVFALLDQ